MPDLADSSPILVIASLNFSRSSALSMDSARRAYHFHAELL